MRTAPVAVLLPSLCLGSPVPDLERRVSDLADQVEQSRRELQDLEARLRSAREDLIRALQADGASEAPADWPAELETSPEGGGDAGPVPPDEVIAGDRELDDVEPFRIGPLDFGGALRVNFVNGSYRNDDPGQGPSRGSTERNVELDTFAVELALDYGPWFGEFQYRWYADSSQDFPASYNFLHSLWLGYRFDASELQAGINRVPFGAGPFGVSQSYLYDLTYYVGLADDMDLGLRYAWGSGDWRFDAGYYLSSEGHYNGRSADSARYSYDAVLWKDQADEDGNVSFGTAPRNGYRERNQLVLRAVRTFGRDRISAHLGASLLYTELDGTGVNDGSRWAMAVHAVGNLSDWQLAAQLSRYEYDIDPDNPWNEPDLIPMGAFDFAWPVATAAWLPAISLSHRYETTAIPWLDYVRPYLEYSALLKDAARFTDSQMATAGAQWSHGGWFIVTDLAYSNGNIFVGNSASGDGTDDYSRLDGVGDFGINGNDRWNYRFTLNLGYYF